MTTLEADYLIVGSGAAGMAFADTLINETNASIVMVDRHHAPGGHWNDAYPFVRLHQPSAYYGVNSRPLGSDALDTDPLNAGMTERASGIEILAYYEQVMRSLQATGRLRYFPSCDYIGGDHPLYRFRALQSGEVREISVRHKLVDTTYWNIAVPSTRPPRYAVAAGVNCMPVNGLARISEPYAAYVIIGAGKTGIDACLWLLERGVPHDAIVWVVSRDPWLFNRAKFQKGDAYFEATLGGLVAQIEASAEATSIDNLLARLEAEEVFLRIDPTIQPTMFHGAIVSSAELARLRQIRHIVRMGHVQRVERERIVFDHGTLAADPGWVYVDCSASALVARDGSLPPVPVFQGPTIVPQMVRTFQPVFSAAFIAHLEATMDDEAEMNALCTPVPMSDQPRDWALQTILNLRNNYMWSKNPELEAWIRASRLDAFTAMARQVTPDQPERMRLLMRYAQNAGAAAANLKKLLAAQSLDVGSH